MSRHFTLAIHGRNHWRRFSEYHRKASGLLGGCCTSSTWRSRWIWLGPTVAISDVVTRRLTGISSCRALGMGSKLSPSQCFVLIKQSDSPVLALDGMRDVPFPWTSSLAFAAEAACLFFCLAFFFKSFWASLRLEEFYFRWYRI